MTPSILSESVLKPRSTTQIGGLASLNFVLRKHECKASSLGFCAIRRSGPRENAFNLLNSTNFIPAWQAGQAAVVARAVRRLFLDMTSGKAQRNFSPSEAVRWQVSMRNLSERVQVHGFCL